MLRADAHATATAGAAVRPIYVHAAMKAEREQTKNAPGTGLNAFAAGLAARCLDAEVRGPVVSWER